MQVVSVSVQPEIGLVVQVGEMAGVCQRKAVVVAETKASCETLLVQIVADKRVADDQEKQVGLTW